MIKEEEWIRSQSEKIAEGYQLDENGADLRKVLRQCQPVMDSLVPGKPPEKWMDYCYQFLQASYFPQNFQLPEMNKTKDSVLFYLETLNRIFEREQKEISFDPLRDFSLLREQEMQHTRIRTEYERFLHCIKDKYVYAFMRLSHECTPFNTLGHVAGVHHIAMYMARQLAQLGERIDLGLVSGSAMLHDIGKFASRPSEMRRTPYLHYYYAYQFCEKMDLTEIGRIASNHSVWDLELDNLSIENLLLIYADFRSRSVFDGEHRESIRFWPLDDAYQVILSKLDNVDDRKRKRYEKVYGKLKDFENYLTGLGCSTDLISPHTAPAVCEAPALMSAKDIPERFKALAIRSNLLVMDAIGHEEHFLALLEDIRSEKDWRHVRALLTAIDEYSTYLFQSQKDVILDVLFEMLSHKDGDVRRQAARITGKLIAGYEICFTKEIPEGYSAPELGVKRAVVWRRFLERIQHPDKSSPDRLRRWTGYSMKTVLRTLLELLSGEDQREILDIYVEKCADCPGDMLIRFAFTDGASEISYRQCSAAQTSILEKFVLEMLHIDNQEISTAALRFFLQFMREGFLPGENLSEEIRTKWPDLDHESYSIRYLSARIEEFYGIPSEQGIRVYDLSNLYLENQRADFPWIKKFINLKILNERQKCNHDRNQLYQYASHLLNMLQFSGRVVNRMQAGENLVELMPQLSGEQRHEIVIELIRAIEVGDIAVSRYIPPFLGRIYCALTGEERADCEKRIEKLTENTNPHIVTAAIETVGKILEYSSEQPEDTEEIDQLEGILLGGIAHYNPEVVQEAFYVIGHGLFGSHVLTLDQKQKYFCRLGRKLLCMLKNEILGPYAYSNAAALLYIYRFISEYWLEEHKAVYEEAQRNVAFFPGTFDPFSLGHKEIVKEVVRRGFRVFLGLDSFSWSKKTQPYEVRRKIIQLSTAGMRDVFLYPEETPVNIANPEDLEKLAFSMKTSRVFIVTGTDVVANASAYKEPEKPYSIHTFPHLIFARGCRKEEIDLDQIHKSIHADVEILTLSQKYAGVSSTMIRDNISSNKDISGLVDEKVQRLIYERGLYSMEPTYKKAARVLPLDTYVKDNVSDELFENLQKRYQEITGQENGLESCRNEKVLYLCEKEEGNRICGAAFFHETDFSGMYQECGNIRTADILRSRISGKTAVISRAFGQIEPLDDKKITVVNELLMYLQENGCSYVLCFDPGQIREALKLHGAVDIAGCCLMIDLRHPLVVFYDTPSSLKEAMFGSMLVRKAVRESHLRLLKQVVRLYPGQLVLTFDSNILNYRLIQLITEENKVPVHPLPVRRLGEKMCVPFGKILKGVLIPNTVTKELDTERMYSPDLSEFHTVRFPGYAPLELQIRSVKSMMRPVILVDDLYHEGHRLAEIDRTLKKEGIVDPQLIVGVISGHGQDLAHSQNKKIKAAYKVPNMRACLTESDLFPFLGGDGIQADRDMSFPALPSVNPILPYEIPETYADADINAFYGLSEVCLESSLEILRAVEKEYSRTYRRKLTMERLGEVFAEPRYPEGAGSVPEMKEEAPSVFLENELCRLKRFKNLMGYQSRSIS